MAKLNISVCMGSSCFARGNNENLEFIEKYIRHPLRREMRNRS